MRMDRYEDNLNDLSKKSRTDKNQELYTDVYLNNAYVDISEITEVVNEEKKEDEEIKKNISLEPINYTYQEKNYDINELINEAIKNNDDKLKRSIEHTTEIDNIIKSINENQQEKEKNNNLLSELLPDNDTTTIVEPLKEAILDTKLVDTSIIHKEEMDNEILEEIEENKENSKKNVDDKEIENDSIETEMDDSFKNETKSNKKIFFIIFGVILLIAIVIVILFYKKIIKF